MCAEDLGRPGAEGGAGISSAEVLSLAVECFWRESLRFQRKAVIPETGKCATNNTATPAGCPVLSSVARSIRTTECECVFVWIRDALSAGRGEIKQMCPLFIPFFLMNAIVPQGCQYRLHQQRRIKSHRASLDSHLRAFVS